METFMNGAMVVEGALFSVLLALWITWLALRGLFRLMPVPTRESRTIHPLASGQDRGRQVA